MKRKKKEALRAWGYQGDPTPVCTWCSTYIPAEAPSLTYQDGRMSCMACEAQRRHPITSLTLTLSGPSDIEVERAVTSIRKASRDAPST